MSASSSPDGAWSFGSSFLGGAGFFIVIFQWRTGLEACGSGLGSLLPRALSWVNTRAASHRESLLSCGGGFHLAGRRPFLRAWEGGVRARGRASIIDAGRARKRLRLWIML